MTKSEQIFDLVERTMNSLDDIPAGAENPFLYTRIMESREERRKGSRIRYRLSPWLGELLMILIVLVNCATLIIFYKTSSLDRDQKELVRELKEVLQVGYNSEDQ